MSLWPMPYPCVSGGSYRGKTGHDSSCRARRFMTHRVTSRPSITALQKVFDRPSMALGTNRRSKEFPTREIASLLEINSKRTHWCHRENHSGSAKGYPHRRGSGDTLCVDPVEYSSSRTIASHTGNSTRPTHQVDQRAGIHHQGNRVEGLKCTKGEAGCTGNRWRHSAGER